MLVAFEQPISNAFIRLPEPDLYSTKDILTPFNKQHQEFFLGHCYLNEGKNINKMTNKLFHN